ncbi:hypothetical protein CBM2586_A110009 [Cupriavidus phytorum]|uniref:Transposase n=1 Tax=Cupriavidus taiwanensis TaxID=164546 RepID=A0A976A405_9BURK|nr:hypothetical protein CBM2586_A110009 [Cupriavidus taiwanensis]
MGRRSVRATLACPLRCVKRRARNAGRTGALMASACIKGVRLRACTQLINPAPVAAQFLQLFQYVKRMCAHTNHRHGAIKKAGRTRLIVTLARFGPRQSA